MSIHKLEYQKMYESKNVDETTSIPILCLEDVNENGHLCAKQNKV